MYIHILFLGSLFCLGSLVSHLGYLYLKPQTANESSSDKVMEEVDF